MGSINTDGQNTANINEGVTILTASRSSQTSMEVNGHGVFTSLLIEALMVGLLMLQDIYQLLEYMLLLIKLWDLGHRDQYLRQT